MTKPNDVSSFNYTCAVVTFGHYTCFGSDVRSFDFCLFTNNNHRVPSSKTRQRVLKFDLRSNRIRSACSMLMRRPLG